MATLSYPVQVSQTGKFSTVLGTRTYNVGNVVVGAPIKAILQPGQYAAFKLNDGSIKYYSTQMIIMGTFMGIYIDSPPPPGTIKAPLQLTSPAMIAGGDYLSTSGVVISLPGGSQVPLGWMPAIPGAYIFSSAGNFKQVLVNDGQDIRSFAPTQDGNYQIRGMDRLGMSFTIWTITKGTAVQSDGVATLIGYTGPGLPPPIVQPSQTVFTPTEAAAGMAIDLAANPSSSKFVDVPPPSGDGTMKPDDAGSVIAGEGEVVYQDNDTGAFVVVPAGTLPTGGNFVPIGAGGDGMIRVPLPAGYITYQVNPSFGTKFEDVFSWSPVVVVKGAAGVIAGSSTLLDSFLMAIPSDQTSIITDNYGGYVQKSTSQITIPLGWTLYSAYFGSTKVYISIPSTYPPKSDWVKLNSLVEIPSPGTPANKVPVAGGSTNNGGSIWGGITTSGTLKFVAQVVGVVGIGGLMYVSYLIITNPEGAKVFLMRFDEFKGLLVDGAMIVGALAFIGALGFVVVEFTAAYEQAGSIGGALGLLTADILETFVTALVELTKDLVDQLGNFIDAEVSSLGKALENIV